MVRLGTKGNRNDRWIGVDYKGKEQKMISGGVPLKNNGWILVPFTQMKKIYEEDKQVYEEKDPWFYFYSVMFVITNNY